MISRAGRLGRPGTASPARSPIEDDRDDLRVFGWFLALSLSGQRDNLEPTDRLVPPGYKGNPWGPAATLARQKGELPPIVMTPKMAQWDKWGRAVLKEGDIVFRRGDAYILFGKFPFSRWLANCSGSPFSHTGIVAIEDGGPVVYDTTHSSVRRQPFHIWILDNVGAVGVKRLKPDQRSHIPQVIAFCRKLFVEQPPFDFELDLDDKAYYCLEMTEKAFRSAGPDALAADPRRRHGERPPLPAGRS